MNLLVLTPKIGKDYHHPEGIPSKAEREFTALRAVALDAEHFPILSQHWPHVLLVDGQLCCHDDSQLAGKFKTEPKDEPGEPDGADNWEHVGSAVDRVMSRIEPKTDEAA